jgi:hypothetical protein
MPKFVDYSEPFAAAVNHMNPLTQELAVGRYLRAYQRLTALIWRLEQTKAAIMEKAMAESAKKAFGP